MDILCAQWYCVMPTGSAGATGGRKTHYSGDISVTCWEQMFQKCPSRRLSHTDENAFVKLRYRSSRREWLQCKEERESGVWLVPIMESEQIAGDKDVGESALILPGEQETGQNFDVENQEMAEEMAFQLPGEQKGSSPECTSLEGEHLTCWSSKGDWSRRFPTSQIIFLKKSEIGHIKKCQRRAQKREAW